MENNVLPANSYRRFGFRALWGALTGIALCVAFGAGLESYLIVIVISIVLALANARFSMIRTNRD